MKRKIYVTDCLKIVFKTDFFYSLGILLFNIVLAIVPTLQTLAIADFIDSVNENGTLSVNDPHLHIIIAVMVGLMACVWIGKSVTELFEKHLEMTLNAKVKPEIVEKITRLEYSDMENEEIRDSINRVNENAAVNIKDAYNSLILLMSLILKVSGILIILFTQVWWAALIILGVSIPCFYISMKSGKEKYDADIEVSNRKRFNEYYHEILKSREYAEERTIFGYQKEISEKYITSYEQVRKFKLKVRLKWYIRMKLGGMATVLVSAVMIAVLVPSVLSEQISVGLFMALLNSVFNIVQNMSWELSWAIDSAAWFNAYFKDMDAFMRLKESDTSTEKKRVGKFESIEFKNVSFQYPGTEEYILNDLSFTIHEKQKYAFVGENGAGKSTVVKLLNGLYECYEGEILLNGEDIRSFDRSFIANVFQDFARYPVSIRDNISVSCKDEKTACEIEKVIDDMELNDLIEKFDSGIDTVLGKGKQDSVDISGGEWQKIALARCAVSDAALKVLDEPTSAMDPVYEAMIYNKFRDISQNNATILISHRLASVKMADTIFVLDKGKIVEQGNHDELIRQGGLYEKMYKEQAKWYEEAV